MKHGTDVEIGDASPRDWRESEATMASGLRLYESADVEEFAPFATLAPMWLSGTQQKWALYRFDGAIDFFANDDEVWAYVARNKFVARAR